MHDNIKRLYIEGRLTDKGLDNAVTRGWITQAEADEIKNEKAV